MIALSITAQTKMALHSAKHGFSNPIHGIVLGKTTNDGTLQVVDVVPVCHEVPTKPIIDMALRLTDAYLQQQQQRGEKRSLVEGVKIIGWYTANANASSVVDEEELPNTSACRITSSMAENTSDDGNGGEFVLLLVSTSRLVDCVKKTADASSKSNALPICTVFEKDKSRTFTQKVDDSRVITTSQIIDGNAAAVDDDIAGAVLSKAMQQIMSEGSIHGGDAAGGGGGGAKGSIAIYDYVDHLTDCGEGDWIENGLVNEFVLDSSR